MGRLLELPEVLGNTLDGGRGVEDDVGPVEPEDPGPVREVPVIADVDGDLAHTGLPDRVPEVTRLEVVLLVESGVDVGDVDLAVLAQIGSVPVDDRGRVVVDPGHLALVDRQDQHDAVLLGLLAEELHRGAGDRLGKVVPPLVVLCAEVGSVKELLKTDHLAPFGGRLFEELDVFLVHGVLDRLELFAHIPLGHLRGVRRGRDHIGGLDDAALHDIGHLKSSLPRLHRAHPIPRLWRGRFPQLHRRAGPGPAPGERRP